MYQMMNADYFVSCLYFIAGIIVLNYWSVVVKPTSYAPPRSPFVLRPGCSICWWR